MKVKDLIPILSAVNKVNIFNVNTHEVEKFDEPSDVHSDYMDKEVVHIIATGNHTIELLVGVVIK